MTTMTARAMGTLVKLLRMLSRADAARYDREHSGTSLLRNPLALLAHQAQVRLDQGTSPIEIPAGVSLLGHFALRAFLHRF